ncbi:DUF4838 domain-containing protein [Prosthecobacter sp.]|uniref:DUF4838 domain-containing protein n=1 Tax=Prosthecobacter sp. TaxID=1965333 RepID=UPI0037831268
MKLPLLSALLLVGTLPAADLVLLDAGRSDYQIVIPDKAETPVLADCLAQTARLLQVAFQANGAEVRVVSESERDAAKPALLLGNTRFAQEHGFKAAELRDWSYVHRVIGKDVIIAGRDEPSRTPNDRTRRPSFDRVGTAKAAVDFARQFMGVRFLYPDLPGYTQVSGAAKIDLLNSPALEFLPQKSITVPDTLNTTHTPLLRVNTSHPAGASFYDLAHNRFPRVDELFGSHTWQRAVPAENFATHPEYFALINGARLKPEGGNAQYCLSNPEVQDLIYRDLTQWLDKGYSSVDLGQPDGFRECQCEKCAALYGTGKDWSEKIWIFNRQMAERVEKSHPGRQITMMSYILTAPPPKTFTKFPANTCIMLTGTNEEDISPWRGIEVPRGFTGYVYNWCPNLGTRYTPMRTPGYIELQVRRLAENRIQSLYRDGPGQLFGLEGPVYYTLGRMFDDPASLHARDLLVEYCEAAFVNKSTAFYMRAFYEELYQAIALYSDHIGTRTDLWTFKPLPTDARGRKTVTDPFQLIAFLYPPRMLASLEASLSQSEKLANTPKVKTRLALVRCEFDYLKHFARVVHLHQAYQMMPDSGAMNRLLDAIDARNAFLTTLFVKGHQKEWNHVLFPFPGHDINHLRLKHDGYQEPYASTCFNWDTKAMRTAPPPGQKKLTVARTNANLTLDSPEWQSAAAHELTLLPPLHTLPRKTTVRLLHDGVALHIRAEAETGDETKPFPAYNRDRLLTNQEAFDVYLAPQPAQPLYYRLTQGANAASRYDALNGRITDVMDPRHGKDDPTWNGDWTSTTRVDAAARRWYAHLVIPYGVLGVEAPAKGTAWRANFGRNHALPREQVDRALWSSTLGSLNMDDPAVMGEIVFE